MHPTTYFKEQDFMEKCRDDSFYYLLAIPIIIQVLVFFCFCFWSCYSSYTIFFSFFYLWAHKNAEQCYYLVQWSVTRQTHNNSVTITVRYQILVIIGILVIILSNIGNFKQLLIAEYLWTQDSWARSRNPTASSVISACINQLPTWSWILLVLYVIHNMLCKVSNKQESRMWNGGIWCMRVQWPIQR